MNGIVYLMFFAIVGIISLIYKEDQKMFTGELIIKQAKCIEKEYEYAFHGYHCYVSFQYENLIFSVDDPFAYENIKIDDSVEIVFRKKCTHLDKKNPKNNQYKLVPSILKIKNQEIKCYEGRTLEKEDFEKYYKEDKKYKN